MRIEHTKKKPTTQSFRDTLEKGIVMWKNTNNISELASLLTQMETKNVPKANDIDCYQSFQAFVEAKELSLAKRVLDFISKEKKIQLNPLTCLSLTKVCNTPSTSHLAKIVHQLILKSGVEMDTRLLTGLITMFGKCGNPTESLSLFAQIHKRDTFAWNAIIAILVQNNKAKEALELFEEMQQSNCKPDGITFTSLLSACAKLKNLDYGKKIHFLIQQQIKNPSIQLQHSLFNMYVKCNELESAETVFHQLNKQHQLTTISWNIMISGYVHNQQYNKALDLFQQMKQQHCKPSEITYALLFTAITNLEDIELGKTLHQEIL